MIIGCKWAGQPQKVTPDDYCHRCPFTTHSDECTRYRKAHHVIFVEEMEEEEWSEELEECRMYKERIECEKEIAKLEVQARDE